MRLKPPALDDHAAALNGGKITPRSKAPASQRASANVMAETAFVDV